jgi:hypothetical protein
LGARHFWFACLNIFHIFFIFFTNVILYYSHVIVCLWNTWIYLNTVCNVLCQITCMNFMYLNKYKDQCILLKPQKLVTMNKSTFIVIVDKSIK